MVARPSTRVLYAMTFAALSVALLFLVKPKPVFDERGVPRPFGSAEGHTFLSVGSCTIYISVFALYVFTWIDLVFA
jgi:hypothetical protein